MTASPSAAHSFTALQLGSVLLQHVKAHKLGVVLSDLDHVLTLHNVRRPDLLYFRSERVELIGEGPIRHPPDLAVEVLSPGSGRIDRVDKFEAYRAFGVQHYWIVDPIGRTIKAFKLRRKKYEPAGSGGRAETVSFPPFEALEISLGDLWWPPK